VIESKYPLVTVLIPCFNAFNTIEQTVLSVINQTYKNFEIIINDDYSDDGTLKLLNKKFKKFNHITIYQNEKNLGTAGNWNQLFKKANGKYWLKLDGDDLIKPDFLVETVAIAEEHHTDFTGTSFESLNLNTGIKKTPYIHNFLSSGMIKDPVESIFVNHPFHLCFTLLKADFVKSISPNFEYFINTEVCDAEFQVRASLQPQFKAYFINRVLAYYCFHDNNSSLTPLKQAKSFIYDLVGIHHQTLKKRLGMVYRKKIIRNFIIYLKLMLKKEAPLDLKLLFYCLKRAWF
jgi:glycosyltransferase involved in cell wall biosynthesis